METKQKLDQIFSVQKQRVIMNDYTIRFENQYFQLNREQPTTVYKKDKIIVEKYLDEKTIKLSLKGHNLNYTVLPERPKKEINIKLPALTIRKQSSWKPPINHPWRNQFLYEKLNNKQQILKQNN